MRKIRSLIYILVLLAISGCGRKEVDYSVDDTAENSGGYSDISMDKISEKIGVEELWEETINADDLKKVYAEVIVPDVTGMKVVDMEAVKYFDSPEDKERFIRSLTSGDIYWYGNDYRIKEDYDWDIASVQALIDYFEAEGGYSDDEYDSLVDALTILEEERENAPEDYVSAENFEENDYIIEYNGIDYWITFSDYTDRTESIYIQPKDYTDFVDKENFNLIFDDVVITSSDENRCLMTEEEARQEALDFINNLNIGEFSCVDTKALKYTMYTNSNSQEHIITPSTEQIEYYDGYTFRFLRSIDGINVDGNYYRFSDTYLNQIIVEEVDDIANYLWFPKDCMEEITIRVNDKGIVNMEYCSPMHITSINAENVNLLSFDKVKAALAYEIDSKDYYGYKTFRYLELTYFNYYDKELNKNCIIPVWRLTDKSFNSMVGEEEFSYVMINAMDGSVINVGEQITMSNE